MEYRWQYGITKDYYGQKMLCLTLYDSTRLLGKFIFNKDDSDCISTEDLYAVVFIPGELEEMYECLDTVIGPMPEDKNTLAEVKGKWQTLNILCPGEVWYHIPTTCQVLRKMGSMLKSLIGFGR